MDVVSEPTLFLVIGCDADPDRPRYGAPRYDSREPLQWRGIQETLPLAGDLLNSLRDSHGVRPLVTWCVRSDLQVAELHGEPAWSYVEFRDTWHRLEDEGDEIAWHPHLWRWSDAHHSWYQEIEDDEWISRCLEEGFASLADQVRRPLLSARMGWEFHNNLTMHKLAELGIAVDFSGSPGRESWPDSENEGARFDRRMDWAITRDRPYRPAAADYRRRASEGEGTLAIWEVPTSSYVPALLRLAAQMMTAARKVRKGKFGEAVRPRVLRSALHAPGIAMWPEVVHAVIQRKVEAARREGEALLVLPFHADELLAPTGKGKQRFYGLEYFRQNLVTILETAQASGVQVRPVPAGAMAARLDAASAERERAADRGPR